jgi:TPR repeat protein
MQPPNFDAARGWYERTANAGRSGAMTALGDLYAQLIQPPDLDATGMNVAAQRETAER